MFYKTTDPHGLKHNPFNAIVVPRPIGWISTVDEEGTANLAPYSFFNAVAYTPPQVIFSATHGHVQGGQKDSVKNAERTGEFVVNLATWELREQMNASAVPAPSNIDEFEYAGLKKAPSVLVKPPRVADSPVHLECRHTQTVQLASDDPDNPTSVVFGEVVAIHIADWAIVDGVVDTMKLQPIARLGYLEYGRMTEKFEMERPTWSKGHDEQ
jgi:flavin reductase (DIM6/NTAB) family NADH-FMN oxidoreductase RutF